MQVLHTSDLHGRYKPLLRALAQDDYDLWIDTGDLLPNPNRDRHGHDWHATNRTHQSKWLGFKSLAKRIAEALDGRPAILVRGNHDFVSLAQRLKPRGVPVTELTAGVSVEHGEHRFAGFGEVVRHHGRWSGEVEQGAFEPLVRATMDQAPTVLCTHSPAYGVLDQVDTSVATDDAHIGVRALAQALEHGAHDVRLHLFGHVHETAGQQVDRFGVRCSNGALGFAIHTL